ncbi:MAG: metal-dependent hydrolase [Betaproteobacteria bacterium]
MRFALLGSGSGGNALVVEQGTTRALVDCGFGARVLRQRLERLSLSETMLTAIVLTHEHSDHVAGACRLARKHDLPIYLTHGTRRGLPPSSDAPPRYIEIDSHRPFVIGDLHVQPFPVPHDAHEPVQYVFGNGQERLGLLTDIGHVTQHVRRTLEGCHALILECNHDRALLADGPYHARLKARIRGDYGHLDNAASAALLAELAHPELRHVVAAHLSKANNRPELARAALAGALGCSQDDIDVADQDDGLDWRECR